MEGSSVVSASVLEAPSVGDVKEYSVVVVGFSVVHAASLGHSTMCVSSGQGAPPYLSNANTPRVRNFTPDGEQEEKSVQLLTIHG